jgi:hypothetical protein
VITLVRTEQTCHARPSQWDAWDVDGNYYYLRYRWGHGTVHRYNDPDPETWIDHPDAFVAEFHTGEPMGGVIDLDEFCQRAGIRLELSDG